MQVLRIPEPVQERLRRQISAAIRSLQLPLQEEQDLEVPRWVYRQSWGS